MLPLARGKATECGLRPQAGSAAGLSQSASTLAVTLSVARTLEEAPETATPAEAGGRRPSSRQRERYDDLIRLYRVPSLGSMRAGGTVSSDIP